MAGPVVNEGVVAYLGLSMLPVGARLPSASGDKEQDAAPAADVGSRFAAFMALSCSKVLSLVVFHGKYTYHVSTPSKSTDLAEFLPGGP